MVPEMHHQREEKHDQKVPYFGQVPYRIEQKTTQIPPEAIKCHSFDHLEIPKISELPQSIDAMYPKAPSEATPKPEPKIRGRKRKMIDKCPHIDQQHYAKGMCNYCYHTQGRKKLATKCDHPEKLAYARGMCHNCYNRMHNLNKKRTVKQIDKGLE